MEDVVKLYNDMVYYSNAPYCVAALPHDVVFRSKKTVQVVSKLKNIMSPTMHLHDRSIAVIPLCM